jgi:hypothetical protein
MSYFTVRALQPSVNALLSWNGIYLWLQILRTYCWATYRYYHYVEMFRERTSAAMFPKTVSIVDNSPAMKILKKTKNKSLWKVQLRFEQFKLFFKWLLNFWEWSLKSADWLTSTWPKFIIECKSDNAALYADRWLCTRFWRLIVWCYEISCCLCRQHLFPIY